MTENPMNSIETDFAPKNEPVSTSVDSSFRCEWELLKSAPTGTLLGIQDRLKSLADHPSQIAQLAVEGAAVGFALALFKNNPDALWGAGKHITNWAGRVGVALMAKDLVVRVGSPAIDTWNNPSHLEDNKAQLGKNLGGAVVEYSTMGLAGIAGYKYLYPTSALTTIGALKSEPSMRAPSAITGNLETRKLPTPLPGKTTDIRPQPVDARPQPVHPRPLPVHPRLNLPRAVNAPQKFESPQPATTADVQSIEAPADNAPNSMFVFDDIWQPKHTSSNPHGPDPHAEVHDPWMPANDLDPYGNKMPASNLDHKMPANNLDPYGNKITR